MNTEKQGKSRTRATMRIAVELDHTKALDMYTQAGHGFPAIPDGANTVWHPFVHDGRPAVIVNQKGFRRLVADNEEQVNGCCVAYVIDDTDDDTARATLAAWVEQMLGD